MGDAFTTKPSSTGSCNECGKEISYRFREPDFCGNCRHELGNPENVDVDLDLTCYPEERYVEAQVTLTNTAGGDIILGKPEDSGTSEGSTRAQESSPGKTTDFDLVDESSTSYICAVVGYLELATDTGGYAEDVCVRHVDYSGMRLDDELTWSTTWGNAAPNTESDYRNDVMVRDGDPFDGNRLEASFAFTLNMDWDPVTVTTETELPDYLVDL